MAEPVLTAAWHCGLLCWSHLQGSVGVTEARQPLFPDVLEPVGVQQQESTSTEAGFRTQADGSQCHKPKWGSRDVEESTSQAGP